MRKALQHISVELVSGIRAADVSCSHRLALLALDLVDGCIGLRRFAAVVVNRRPHDGQQAGEAQQHDAQQREAAACAL